LTAWRTPFRLPRLNAVQDRTEPGRETLEDENRMSTAERDAQREDLRERIVEGVRDIVGEEGLDALSMRALGLRVGCSPATIYLHFQDKDELLRSVMEEGFKRLGATVGEELGDGRAASAMERLAATARGYVRFALENTGYFRAMFEVPGVARMEGCPASHAAGLGAGAPGRGMSPESTSTLLRQAQEEGGLRVEDLDRVALVGWGLMHGLTSLYLTGHLAAYVSTHEEFMDLIDGAIEALRAGWKA
jgi:AcrR family transcriptional regulator